MGGGREVPVGGDICLPAVIHVHAGQKPTQRCKAIMLQLKINKLKNKVLAQALLLEKKFYWSTVDLRCCITFCCPAK